MVKSLLFVRFARLVLDFELADFFRKTLSLFIIFFATDFRFGLESIMGNEPMSVSSPACCCGEGSLCVGEEDVDWSVAPRVLYRNIVERLWL